MRWAPRRHPDRPGRGRYTAVLLAAVLAGCTNSVTGQPTAIEIGPLTAKEAVDQSLKADLAEAAALQFTGDLTSSDRTPMSISVTALATGEVFGTIALDGLQATILVIDRVIYLKAATDFWTVNAPRLGILAADASALADRWVEVPTDLITISFGDILTPTEIVRSAGEVAKGDQLLPDKPTGDVGGVEAVEVPTAQGTVTLAAAAPHGVLKIDLKKLGRPGGGGNGATDVALTVKDVSAQANQFYADLAKQAKAELGLAIDGLTTVLQTGNRFEPCGDPSCTLAVDFTNESKLAVRVHLRAAWNGDNQPLGNCDATSDPVAPGATGTISCQIATPEWVSFWQRANTVAGEHPYGAVWSTVVLASPPDLAALERRAATKPTPQKKGGTGKYHVYRVTHGGEVWKFGATKARDWQQAIEAQLRGCESTTDSACAYHEIAATDDGVAAGELVSALVAEYRKDHEDKCPEGQWVGCTR
jgi:hypothetical protein